MKLYELTEALKASQYRKYVQGWDKSRYNDIFGGKYRIELPTPVDNKPARPDPYVERALNDLGYEIHDYIAGIAIKDNRKMRIGRLITDPTIVRRFTNDPARHGAKKITSRIIISRHPYDIAGMSTNRGWSSCMNIDTGLNREYVALDVKEGTIVAYLVEPDDSNITKPIARILIKPFINNRNEEVALGVENAVYGNAPPWFAEEVEKWANEVNASKQLIGMYYLPSKLYNDDIEPIKIMGRLLATEDIAAALKSCDINHVQNVFDSCVVTDGALIECATFNVARLAAIVEAANEASIQITPKVETEWCKIRYQSLGRYDMSELIEVLWLSDAAKNRIPEGPCEEAILVALEDDRDTLIILRKHGYKLTPKMIELGNESLLSFYYSDHMDYDKWCDLIDAFQHLGMKVPPEQLKELANSVEASLYYATINKVRFEEGEQAMASNIPEQRNRLFVRYLTMIYHTEAARPQPLLNALFEYPVLWAEYIENTVPPDRLKRENSQYPSLIDPKLEPFHHGENF